MNENRFNPKRNPIHDEAVWNAWPQKDAKNIRTQYIMLAKFAGIAVVVGVVMVFLWAWNTIIHRRQPVRVAANHFLGR